LEPARIAEPKIMILVPTGRITHRVQKSHSYVTRNDRHIGMWINENVQQTSRGRSVPTNAIVSPVPRLMGLLSLGLWFLRAELVPNLFQG